MASPRSESASGRHGSFIPSRGHCPASGKRRWVSRSDAKLIARRVQRDDGARMSAYRCDDCGDFHVGHAGTMTRAEHRDLHERRGESRAG